MTEQTERIAPGKEHRQRVRVRKVTRKCGETACGGHLVGTGFMLLSLPPYHRNKCDKCGRIYDLSESYPHFEYIPE